ncbi:hypothetical protein HAL07_11830 [Helicobacter ailurogastricus]|uniref:Uncharacterized protein n=1 Tax=Helicobacter ailurogastricus TaxID=1578720 RepID=A0A0K2Y1B4_9HELI|nr:hypothetical protein HAL07_11830 [Helicobacter ailurogastricus]
MQPSAFGLYLGIYMANKLASCHFWNFGLLFFSRFLGFCIFSSF